MEGKEQNLIPESSASNKSPNKLSYEELNRAAGHLQHQNELLLKELDKAISQEFVMRMNYLFKVIENTEVFDPVFVDKCVGQIQEALTPPEEGEVE